MLMPSRFTLMGLQGLLLTHASASKPASVKRFSASTPPATTTSAKSAASRRAALASAFGAEVQAVDIANTGPRAPLMPARNSAGVPRPCWSRSKSCGNAPSGPRRVKACCASPMPEVLVPSTMATRPAPWRAMAVAHAGFDLSIAGQQQRVATGAQRRRMRIEDGSGLYNQPLRHGLRPERRIQRQRSRPPGRKRRAQRGRATAQRADHSHLMQRGHAGSIWTHTMIRCRCGTARGGSTAMHCPAGPHRCVARFEHHRGTAIQLAHCRFFLQAPTPRQGGAYGLRGPIYQLQIAQNRAAVQVFRHHRRASAAGACHPRPAAGMRCPSSTPATRSSAVSTSTAASSVSVSPPDSRDSISRCCACASPPNAAGRQ